uniref:Uncharacterized protein n=1 Tax=Anopheles merus TaxID=30066 RepID=A0A182V4G5_ANOME
MASMYNGSSRRFSGTISLLDVWARFCTSLNALMMSTVALMKASLASDRLDVTERSTAIFDSSPTMHCGSAEYITSDRLSVTAYDCVAGDNGQVLKSIIMDRGRAGSGASAGAVLGAATVAGGIPLLPKAGEDVRDEVVLFPFVVAQFCTMLVRICVGTADPCDGMGNAAAAACGPPATPPAPAAVNGFAVVGGS